MDFSKGLLSDMGAGAFMQMVELNKLEINTGICRSHDYIDSNITMLEAMEANGYPFEIESPEDKDKYFTLSNNAWNLAKKQNFYISDLLK